MPCNHSVKKVLFLFQWKIEFAFANNEAALHSVFN